MNVGYNNILSKFNLEVAGVKVTVAIFRKKSFVIPLAPAFVSGF